MNRYTSEETAAALLSQTDAEANLLAQAISRQDWALRLLDGELEWGDFRSRFVADSVRMLLVEGKSVDLFAVSAKLKEHPEVVNHPQGREAVASECLQSIICNETIGITEREFESLHERVKNFSLARRAQRIATALSRALTETPSKTKDHINTGLADLAMLAGGRNLESKQMSWPDAIKAEVELIKTGKHREGLVGTPIGALNAAGGECFPGQFVVVAAEPGAGKTTFILQWARYITKVTGKPVYFEECEMAVRELASRGICSIIGKKVDHASHKELDYAIEVAELEPGLELCCAGGKLKDFLARVHRWMLLHPDTVTILVDYIGLLQDFSANGDAKSGAEQVSDALMGLAQHYGILVVACQQPNRNVEKRTDKTPVKGDLRDSAKLAQDADKIFFLHRPAKYDKSRPAHLVELHVLKNRGGPEGVVDMSWSPATYTFSDWDSTKLPLREGYTSDGQRRFEVPEMEEMDLDLAEFSAGVKEII